MTPVQASPRGVGHSHFFFVGLFTVEIVWGISGNFDRLIPGFSSIASSEVDLEVVNLDLCKRNCP